MTFPAGPIVVEIDEQTPTVIEIDMVSSPSMTISEVGPQGPAGANGSPGTPGSKWYDGASNPTNGLGIVGDFYLNNTSGDIFEKTEASTWTLRMNIMGSSGGSPASNPWVFNVKDYGAKGDGQTVTDGAMTSGSGVVTSSAGKFTSGDVGKAVMVKGAAALGVTSLVGTITAYTSATQVTISVNAALTVSSAVVMWATDDTAAIQEAIDAATDYSLANSAMADVFIPVSTGFYGVAGALSTANSGNGQLTLRPITSTINKVSLRIIGAGDASAVQHWQQLVPQVSGSTLVSFGVFSSVSGQNDNISTHGNPAVIGGPSQPGGYGAAGAVFSNMNIILENVSILTAYSRYGLTYTAFDFSGIANAVVRNMAYGTTGIVATGNDFNSVGQFSTGFSIGALMPAAGNNDNCFVSNVTCHGGYTFAFFATEHTVVNDMRILYSWSAFCAVGNYFGSVGSSHGIVANQLSIESCNNLVYFIGQGAAGIGPFVDIRQLDTEAGAPTFSDNTSGNGLAASLGQTTLTGLYTQSNVNCTAPMGMKVIDGQKQYPIVSVSSNYNVLIIDDTILVDASSAAVNINLNSAFRNPNTYTIVKIDSSSNAVNIVPMSGQTINGNSSKAMITPYQRTKVAAYGSNWFEV